MAAKFFSASRLTALCLAVFAAVGLAQEGGMRIAPRDVLTITTWNEANYSCKCPVGQDGSIDFPFLGQIKVSGLTTREVQDQLKKQLGAKYLVNPQVVVELEQSSNKHFNILGEVRSPGAYSFGGEISVYDALARAGSTTDAAADMAILRRGTSGATSSLVEGRATDADIMIDLHELLSGGSIKSNIVLRDGDTLLVQKAEPVFVNGEVKSAGAYPVTRTTTVFQAVTLAGGLSARGKFSGIKIQRRVEGKKDPVTITVKDPKTELVKPGDTIIVPARIM